MKKMLSFMISAIILFSFSACGQNSSQTVEITADNYEDYFFVTLSTDMDYWGSADDTQFDTTITIKAESKKSALFDTVILKGYVQLPLDKRNSLYTENILPVEATININGSGNGECTVMFSHGIGRGSTNYGGYADTDFYFECVSASGSITLKQ